MSLVEWLEARDEDLRERYERLYVPRKDPRYLRRNALVAPATSAARSSGQPSRRMRRSDDPLLREHAEWALERLDDEPQSDSS